MKEKNEILSGITVILFAAFFYVFSFNIQATTSDILGSRFFPQLASILMIVLGCFQIVTALKNSSNDNYRNEDIESNVSERKTLNSSLILTTVALFAYYFLIIKIGFTITSILYLIVASCILMPEDSKKNKKIIAIVIITSILFPILLNIIFYNIFSIKLPVGYFFR